MSLDTFFRAMGRYFAEPANPASRPEGIVPGERLGLYGELVTGHVGAALDKLYPLCRDAVGEPRWSALRAQYYATRPARHFEVNRSAEAFPALLADQAGGLPEWLPALARFEWADFAVYAHEAELPTSVARLQPNPTLTVLEHPFRLCAYVAAPKPRPDAPERGSELALLWRHPTKHVTTFLAADDRALLALKLAVEGTPLAEASAATRMPETELEALLGPYLADGLLLAPR